jgi:arabinose-5-phosphate isomerase
MKNKIKHLIKQEVDSILNIPVTDNFEKAIHTIHQAVHKHKGKLVCAGMGKAGQIALNIATTFSSTGTSALFLHPAEAQHGDLGILRNNDVLLLISNSGKTREIVELIALARSLYNNLPIVAITGHPDSLIAEFANVTISTGNGAEIDPFGLVPTTSTTTMSIIGDVLVVLMMGKIGFTREQYNKLHHGGYIGSQTKKKKKK